MVYPAEMSLEGLDVAEGAASARGAVDAEVLALPHFVEEVLGAFVAFPVVARAEFLLAVGECAAIGAGVSFHVLSRVQLLELTGEGCAMIKDSAYFRSHSRFLTFPQSGHLCSPCTEDDVAVDCELLLQELVLCSEATIRKAGTASFPDV